MRARTLLVLPLLLAGCSNATTDLDDPEDVKAWANSASALAVFIPAYRPIAVADGQETFADPSCPSVADDGTTMVITGGCTDSDHKRWEGSATVVRGASGSYALTLDAFGSASEGDDAATVTGTFAIERTSDGAHTFDADYTQDGLLVLDVDYTGTIVGGYDTATVWNGQGTITRGGFTHASGTATATTVDQRRDNTVCSSESVSGTTTIDIGGRTAVITYDGATDCDESSAALLRVDGEDRGTIDGISCAVSPGGSGSPFLLAPLIAAWFLLIRRRI